MNRRPSEASPSASVHGENIRQQLTKLIDHVEADIGRVDDPRFRGLLEKSAEVLKGLQSLFERFQTNGSVPKEKRTPAASAGSETAVPRAEARPTAQANSTGSGNSRSKGGDARRGKPGRDGLSRGNGSAKPVGKQAASDAKESRHAGSSAKTDKASGPKPDSKSGEKTDAAEQLKSPREKGSKPQDPAALKAMLDRQRKEARSPKMPSIRAPKLTPPQSGKPVWDKPHSS